MQVHPDPERKGPGALDGVPNVAGRGQSNSLAAELFRRPRASRSQLNARSCLRAPLETRPPLGTLNYRTYVYSLESLVERREVVALAKWDPIRAPTPTGRGELHRDDEQ